MCPTRFALSQPPTDSQSEVLAELSQGGHSTSLLVRALQMDGQEQDALFELARQRRDQAYPSRQVEVRSVVEISNICKQGCHYCNMARHHSLKRYQMKLPEFMETVEHVYAQGRRVLLLQSGENPNSVFIRRVCQFLEEAKSRHADLTLILCMGNLTLEQYKSLRQAGAQRYILKFETANSALYRELKPTDTLENRLRSLDLLFEAGFQVGTGNIAGLPGQTLEDIAHDIQLTLKYALAMVSCSVFVPAETTELRDHPIGSLDLTLNTMALLRILHPKQLMPTTSSLDKARPGGQLRGLMAGANTVTIHDGTPTQYKALFPIYSSDRCTPRLLHLKSIVQQAGMEWPQTSGGAA